MCEKLILIEHLLLICVKCCAGCSTFTSLVHTTLWGEYYVIFAAKNLEVEWSPRGSLGGSVSKESTCNAKETVCNAGDLGLIPGSGRSPGEGSGSPLQYSYLETPMDRGTWRATQHGITRVRHNLVTKPPNTWDELSLDWLQLRKEWVCLNIDQYFQNCRGPIVTTPWEPTYPTLLFLPGIGRHVR